MDIKQINSQIYGFYIHRHSAGGKILRLSSARVEVYLPGLTEPFLSLEVPSEDTGSFFDLEYFILCYFLKFDLAIGICFALMEELEFPASLFSINLIDGNLT
jgi:hypothetical protein